MKQSYHKYRLAGTQGLYWICWKQAYMVLPSSWFGSRVLGSVRPSFFLLLLRQGEKLGVPIYEERLSRQNGVGASQIGNWKDNEWPPDRIIQCYGPATWAEDGPGAIAPLYICSTASSGCRLLLKL
jgi:hypothetical protein